MFFWDVGPPEVRAIPHKNASGEIDGVRLSGIRRGSALETAGFKNGDLLTAVDGGAPEGSDSLSMRLMQAMTDALQAPGTHTMAVVRRGRPETVTVEVEAGVCPE